MKFTESNFFLSVIIPAHNCESLLEQCLDSLISVEQADLEIIVIDDGPTDNTAGVYRDYAERYWFIHGLSQANAGPSAARNKGLDLARGEYVAFVDADDYIDPESFRRNIAFLRNSKADIWIADFFRVADNGCVLDRITQIEPTNEPFAGREYLTSFLTAKECVWNVWRYIFNRKFIEDNKLRFTVGYNIGEDVEFVVKALCLCKYPAFFHAPYYNYRVNYDESLTRRYSAERVRQLMWMLERTYSYLGDDEVSALLRAKLAREYILNLSLLYELPKAERRAAYKILESSVGLMDGSCGVYSIAAKAVKLLGIHVSAAMLLEMKRVKRLKNQQGKH